MGVSRQFQNLIVDSPYGGAKWLRSVDLTHQLFGNTTPLPSTNRDGSHSAVVLDSTSQTTTAYSGGQKKKQAAAVVADLKMDRIRFSSPIFRFQTSASAPNCRTIDCFPLSSSKVAMADQTGRMLLCDAATRHVVPMPNLHKPKSEPISLFVLGADDDANDHPSGGGTLFVMERAPGPEMCDKAQLSDQFEAFISSKPSRACGDMWHCRLLPAPPFVYHPNYSFTYPAEITSYTVVGSQICISTKCNATTYRLDTKSDAWNWEVIKGTLPFYGKVEYAPELKLWFGLSNKTRNLAAADLSTTDSRPQLIGDWKEFDPPEDWMECDDSQIVNLGSGRFCITRSFKIMSMEDDGKTDRIVVFTGVEVARAVHNGNCSGNGSGKVELQMKTHKSRYHMCNATIICNVF